MNVSGSAAPRRRRRLGRVLVAAAVAASVLVVAQDPVQGAGADATYQRLEGNTRYETAVEIAESYVEQVEEVANRTNIDTVILTSGEDEHFGYALPAPALSQLHDAPLLLTEPDTLPAAVTTFLTRYDIRTVIILGGDEVVSQAVATAVDAISGVDVERIDGDDPYSVAVDVAELVGPTPGSPGEFPAQGRTALLATGEVFADALAAGPLAYRGDHPILLTRGASLPERVESFLESSQTEHVVILGGTAAVSASVERDVESLGIEVTRWSGSDRTATAVAIAEALLGSDSPDGCFDGAELGLAYGFRSPDAIVSGPLLGEFCAPLLLTERDELPLVVERFLRSDEFVTGDVDGDVHFTVFGGPAAIASRAVDEVLDAGELTELRARIHAVEGGCHFTVVFSEAVLTSDAERVANYLSGNTPFLSTDATVEAGDSGTTTEAVVTLAGGSVVEGSAVPTGCTSPFEARDRIGVVGGEIESAVDRRTVGREEFFIDDDDVRPALVMNAPEGSSTVWVESSEPLQATVALVMFSRSGDSDVSVVVAVVAGSTMFVVDVPAELGGELRIRDRAAIAGREVQDLAGNENLSITRSVIKDSTPPRVERITVTPVAPGETASITLNATDAGDVSRPSLQVTALAGTAASGAAGNQWYIDVDVVTSRPRSWTATQLTDVQVSTAGQRILARAISEATASDLVDALNLDKAFRGLFSAEVVSAEGGNTLIDTGGRVSLSGGTSTVDLRVFWTEPVPGCNADENPVRPRHIEIDVGADDETDFALDGFAYGSSDVEFVAGDRVPTSIIAGAANCDTTTAGVRAGTLVARIQSSSIDNLPSTQSVAVIRPGAATDLAGNANVRQTGVVLRRP